MQKAKERYSKEKAAKYYLENKEAIIEKSRNIRVNKKEFHKSKQPINLDLVNVDQIVVSDKFRHNDHGFKYFIGYKEGEIVKPLCIIFPQMTGCIKYLKTEEKTSVS